MRKWGVSLQPAFLRLPAVIALGVSGLLWMADRSPRLIVRGQEHAVTYSEKQAKLGAALYEEKCVKCHTGGSEGMGPPMKGDPFLQQWEGKSARLLYRRILSTMPASDPGSLTDTETIDLVAYLLQMNGYAGGGADVESPNALNEVVLTRAK